MQFGRITPYAYQYEDVARTEQFDGRILNANPMGTGKTLETLWALKRNPGWLPALIVVPAVVKFNWEHEASHYMGFSSSVCEGRTPPKYNKYDFSMQSPLTIINYDILHNWVPYLKQLGFKTLVCDECHNLSNPSTIRTKATTAISKCVEHIMMLSGTPLSNRPKELYPILHMLWPAQFPDFGSFASMFCKPQWKPWGWDYSRSDNLDILHVTLNQLGMIRRRKIDVLKDLPAKTRRIIPCELSNLDEYKFASNHFIDWLKQHQAHRVKAASRAEALTKIGYLCRLAARLKIRTPIEWANRFLEETDEKLVMMAVHNGAIEVMRKRINSPSVVLDGTIDNRQKHAAMMQFQHDDRIRVFIGSRSAWSGINLTASSTIGAVELWWRPGDMVQMEDRIYRIGQKSVSTINYFVSVGTIEERLCEILQEKQGVLSAVLDGGPVPNEINLFDILLNEMENQL